MSVCLINPAASPQTTIPNIPTTGREIIQMLDAPENAETLSKIPHRIWQAFISSASQIFNQEENASLKKSFISSLDDAFSERLGEHTTNYIPVFTKPGKHDQAIVLPAYVRVSEEEYFVTPSKFYHGVALTEKAWQEFRGTPKTLVRTKEELDQLTRTLYDIDLISWTITEDCCYARADMAIRFLLLMGIPEQQIRKQYVLTHPPAGKAEEITWGYYHVAVLIELENGSKWIIDPALNKESALTFDQWIELQKVSIKTAPASIQTKEAARNYFAHPTGAISIEIPHNHQIRFSKDHRSFGRDQISEEISIILAHELAQSRSSVETSWLMSCQ